MEKLFERLEASLLMLECIWRVRECENSELARKIDEVLMECEYYEGE